MSEERLHKMINGEKVYLSPEEEAELRAEWAKNSAESDKKKYISQRMAAYGRVEDQLDFIFHNGLDAWKEKIAKIKEEFPKP